MGERERCRVAVVGEAKEGGKLRVEDRSVGETKDDLPMSVLFGNPPQMHKNVVRTLRRTTPFDSNVNFGEALVRVLNHPTVASKKFLITIGDRTVGGLVARDQFVGPWQVPVADVAVTASGFSGYTGEAMAMGERSPIAILSTPASARMAVGEAITNIVSASIAELADVRLSANWMAAVGAEGEDAKLYDAVEAVGMQLCPDLGITIPVGKDSMSMQTRWQEDGEHKTVTSPVSLIVSAFAPVVDIRDTITAELYDVKETKILLLDLAVGRQRLGGSILAQCYSSMGDESPDLESPELIKSFFEFIQKNREEILAYHDRSDGGVITTLLEMAFASRCGLDIIVPQDISPND